MYTFISCSIPCFVFLCCAILLIKELREDIEKYSLIDEYFKMSLLRGTYGLPYIDAVTLSKMDSNELKEIIATSKSDTKKHSDMILSAAYKIEALRDTGVNQSNKSNFIDLVRLNQPVVVSNEFGSYKIFGVGTYDGDCHYGVVFWVSTLAGPQQWLPNEEYDADKLFWHDEPWSEDAYPNYIDFFTKSLSFVSYQEFYSQWPLVLESIEQNGFTLDTAPTYMI